MYSISPRHVYLHIRSSADFEVYLPTCCQLEGESCFHFMTRVDRVGALVSYCRYGYTDMSQKICIQITKGTCLLVGSYTVAGYMWYCISQSLLLYLTFISLNCTCMPIQWYELGRVNSIQTVTVWAKQMMVYILVQKLSILMNIVPKRSARCYVWLAVKSYHSPFGRKVFSCHTSISRVSLAVNLQNSNCIVHVGKFQKEPVYQF